jgi:serine/threonine protein kinase
VRVTAGERDEDNFDYAKAEIELLAPNDPTKLYKIQNEVGKGGFGRVFEAQPLKDRKKLYACKILPHTRTKDRKYNLEEVRFLKKCEHPNVVKFIQAFKVNTRNETQIWMIMELMRGGTLTDAVKAHNFTEPQIAYVCTEMLFGIRFLHRHEIAHRDLKSANVMLTTDGQVKLIDFGLCCDMSEGEQTHMVGSPFWIPPEMIRREPHGYAADVWSFGICTLELANNAIPHRQNSVFAMFSNATKGYPNPFTNPKDYSPLFAEFMMGALALDPKERLTSKQLRDHKFCQKAASAQSMQKVITKIFTRDALDMLNLGM